MMSKERGIDHTGARARDDAGMRTCYAYVCNIRPKEVFPLFGINQNCSDAGNELVVQLPERVILNPFAAKQRQAAALAPPARGRVAEPPHRHRRRRATVRAAADPLTAVSPVSYRAA